MQISRIIYVLIGRVALAIPRGGHEPLLLKVAPIQTSVTAAFHLQSRRDNDCQMWEILNPCKCACWVYIYIYNIYIYYTYIYPACTFAGVENIYICIYIYVYIYNSLISIIWKIAFNIPLLNHFHLISTLVPVSRNLPVAHLRGALWKSSSEFAHWGPGAASYSGFFKTKLLAFSQWAR